MRGIILKKAGDPTNLVEKEIDQPKTMGKDDVCVKHTYVGVNFDDILVRRGLSELKNDEKNPVIGLEGVGTIVKVGSSVTKFKVGQRVGYAFANLGAYCQMRVLNANYCVGIPDEISDESACAILRKGLAAHTMLFRTHIPRKNHIIMVTGAGSGVGQIIARWAKYSGIKVIGVVGSDSKKDSAMSAGCDIVVNYKNEQEALDKVEQFTDKFGVNSVYDAIGKDTFNFCIKSLHVFGTYISFGNASGNITSFEPNILDAKSLFFTRPRFELYKSNRNELVLSAHELFDAFKKGAILTNISRYNFSAIPNAHADIEAKRITGCVVASVS
ncbi:zinc-binding dehydrogenase [Candidatus Deianiraea vastatrix]|uniref:Quinone oxidoreductase 1 n=1 Tax=Candidatus Deianiraea vastatrix TaxID=2163644 RepID=A0A5B8XEN1_9RICK|nr:zinc-binding dehydrogenase [Candidatus Deianiraea vastatrix]QED23345.1 Quinone oxidoreductase 1 [Candidatus Deianiraea vastatrix]